MLTWKNAAAEALRRIPPRRSDHHALPARRSTFLMARFSALPSAITRTMLLAPVACSSVCPASERGKDDGGVQRAIWTSRELTAVRMATRSTGLGSLPRMKRRAPLTEPMRSRRLGGMSRHSSTGTISLESRLVKPSSSLGPDVSTLSSTLLRYPSASEGDSQSATMPLVSTWPIRVRASTTLSVLALSCAPRETCCHWHPPQSPKYGHGGSTRSGEGVTMRSASAFAYVSCSSTIEHSTTSPGAVRGTKTTRPSERCPIPSPPLARRSISRVCTGMRFPGLLLP